MESPVRRCCVLILFSGFIANCFAVNDIILMHGLFEHPKDMLMMKSFILKEKPEARVHIINTKYSGYSTLKPMWRQTRAALREMKTIMEQAPGGIHLICYSQGGLICRAALEMYSNHKVHNFISLSGPLAGQFGDTHYFKYVPKMARDSLYKVLYSRLGQLISVGNYWNDPKHHKDYLKYCDFLPVINNEVNNNNSAVYKQNFAKLHNLILIGGPNDGVIDPWQSSQFGMYGEAVSDDKLKVLPMTQMQWYRSDSFGLRTLAERGSVHVHSVPGVKHHYWIRNHTVFQQYVLPWLREPSLSAGRESLEAVVL